MTCNRNWQAPHKSIDELMKGNWWISQREIPVKLVISQECVDHIIYILQYWKNMFKIDSSHVDGKDETFQLWGHHFVAETKCQSIKYHGKIQLQEVGIKTEGSAGNSWLQFFRMKMLWISFSLELLSAQMSCKTQTLETINRWNLEGEHFPEIWQYIFYGEDKKKLQSWISPFYSILHPIHNCKMQLQLFPKIKIIPLWASDSNKKVERLAGSGWRDSVDFFYY